MTKKQGAPKPDKNHIPLFLSPIHSGFPSPADDYKENNLDLTELLIANPTATFYVKVTGDSMKDACIEEGDILVVDRSIVATHNAIIVALLNGEFTVKRLYHKGQTIYLLPANRRYKPLRITEHMDFQVWGVVTYCIRKVR
jgi:DNA polymerase V